MNCRTVVLIIIAVMAAVVLLLGFLPSWGLLLYKRYGRIFCQIERTGTVDFLNFKVACQGLPVLVIGLNKSTIIMLYLIFL